MSVKIKEEEVLDYKGNKAPADAQYFDTRWKVFLKIKNDSLYVFVGMIWQASKHPAGAQKVNDDEVVSLQKPVIHDMALYDLIAYTLNANFLDHAFSIKLSIDNITVKGLYEFMCKAEDFEDWEEFTVENIKFHIDAMLEMQ